MIGLSLVRLRFRIISYFLGYYMLKPRTPMISNCSMCWSYSNYTLHCPCAQYLTATNFAFLLKFLYRVIIRLGPVHLLLFQCVVAAAIIPCLREASSTLVGNCSLLLYYKPLCPGRKRIAIKYCLNRPSPFYAWRIMPPLLILFDFCNHPQEPKKRSTEVSFPSLIII